jgi:hypothetical protein
LEDASREQFLKQDSAAARLAKSACERQDFSGVSSEVATHVPEQAEPLRTRTLRRPSRALAVQLLGPLTMLGGVVWAVVQPHRIVFLDAEAKGAYDYLIQPPLLVILVGLVYTLLIAPGLVEDLAEEDRGPAR